jgi:RNA polymerase sigma factor (sigma-70 family)
MPPAYVLENSDNHCRMNDLEELIPTRQSLLSRLKDFSDDNSWREFFEIYWKLIYRTGLKAGLSEAEAQDVVQETMACVFKAMPNFEYRQHQGSFKSWLLNLTSWRIRDELRKRDPRLVPQAPANCNSDGTPRTATTEKVPDPGPPVEAIWEADWEANLMEVAIARVKEQVDPKAYQLFDLVVFKEWPVSKVAESFNVSATQVYLARHRIGRRIKREIKLLQLYPVRPTKTRT